MRRWVIAAVGALAVLMLVAIPASMEASRPQRPLGLRYVVALGDSVPAASACDCDGFVEEVARGLADQDHRRTLAVNDAAPGETTAGTLVRLPDFAVARDIAEADIVLIQVGANDIDASSLADPGCAVPTAGCWTDTVSTVQSTLHQIIDRVRALQSHPRTRIVLLGYWNVALAGAVGQEQGPIYVHNAAEATRQVNAVIRSEAARADAAYVDTGAAFTESELEDDDLLAPDGDHPNEAGHRVLATAVLRALKET